MTSRYPAPEKKTPVIQRSDTDRPLPSAARQKNSMRYVYFKKIALGGKCLIRSCKDMHLGRVVCYKSLRSEFADDPLERRQFLREARVTAMLQHPNTAPVYEAGLDARGYHYFTMKLVTGITLREILDGLSRSDPRIESAWDLYRLIDVIIQVGQVMNYAHVHGVIHCDIKPANIVAGSFGEVTLLDWGLAHVHDDSVDEDAEPESSESTPLRSKDAHPGTPEYISPEQIKGQELDQRTDIYSLGAILFEILTGQQLAWGETLDEMLQNRLNSAPPTPSVIAPDRYIPRALESLCLRCIQVDPEHRLQTSVQMIHELLYWLRMDAAYRPR